MSAATSRATSRANSRTPSRGATQDLEVFESVSRQGTQGLIETPPRAQSTQDMGSKGGLKSALAGGASRKALQGKSSSGPVAEGHSGLPDHISTGGRSPLHRHSLSCYDQVSAFSEVSGESFEMAASTEAMSYFLDVAAAQPSYSASSAALRSHWPVTRDSPADSSHAMLVLSEASRKQPDSNSGMPVAEGIEGKAAPKAAARTTPVPKAGLGFMSGASTGHGAVAQAPDPASTPAADGAADRQSPRDDSQQELLPGALPEEGVGLPRYAAAAETMSTCTSHSSAMAVANAIIDKTQWCHHHQLMGC